MSDNFHSFCETRVVEKNIKAAVFLNCQHQRLIKFYRNKYSLECIRYHFSPVKPIPTLIIRRFYLLF